MDLRFLLICAVFLIGCTVEQLDALQQQGSGLNLNLSSFCMEVAYSPHACVCSHYFLQQPKQKDQLISLIASGSTAALKDVYTCVISLAYLFQMFSSPAKLWDKTSI
ncbi:hypothetical protein XENOCAPTIV_025425 [Xenoophorus captivus]|uniref:Uncharacterized protein n=1 Tax=Xenoophorus captivus TaxID=1517983 RepID=A0ABV0RJS0_9TELE